MSNVHTGQGPRRPAADQRRSEQVFGACRLAVYLYGAFLLGVIVCAAGLGSGRVVSACIPFSAIFVISAAGLVVWRQRDKDLAR